jgi:hypothetical protein
MGLYSACFYSIFRFTSIGLCLINVVQAVNRELSTRIISRWNSKFDTISVVSPTVVEKPGVEKYITASLVILVVLC